MQGTFMWSLMFCAVKLYNAWKTRNNKYRHTYLTVYWVLVSKVFTYGQIFPANRTPHLLYLCIQTDYNLVHKSWCFYPFVWNLLFNPNEFRIFTTATLSKIKHVEKSMCRYTVAMVMCVNLHSSSFWSDVSIANNVQVHKGEQWGVRAIMSLFFLVSI